VTSKERFLTAISGGVPDRVPVTPDISNYIPAKRTGLPFWDIYFKGKTSLWKAYIEAAEFYRLDMWIASCTGAPLVWEDGRAEREVTLEERPERDAMVRRTVWHTPDGDLTAEELCFRADPPTKTERPIKDLAEDWKKYRRLLVDPVGVDRDVWNELREEAHSRDQAFGIGYGYPGFQAWEGRVEGSVQALTYAYADTPEILDEWAERELERGTKAVRLILDAKPDYLGLGGSGTLTLASPELAMRYAIPAIARYSAMAKEAGIPTVLHSCGRSRALVDMLVQHTDVSCVNPLEIAPMGDVDLAEVNSAVGSQIALMGNLHTTKVMLHGSEEEVYAAARDAILAAAPGGAFVLSTGDQCPRETPDENLFALHRAVADYGRYAPDGSLLS
jgi:uroporphyrinogen decarboxylase